MTNGHQLRLYNSLGRRVEDFVPSGDVTGMYSCGPTVYAYPHLGNMRAYVSADTVRRVLRWKGYRVRHVVNITDVGHAVADTDTGEDKLEVAAARERRSVLEIADFSSSPSPPSTPPRPRRAAWLPGSSRCARCPPSRPLPPPPRSPATRPPEAAATVWHLR